MEMQAGLGELGLGLAEAQLDRHFVGLHGVDSLEHPERQHGEPDQADEGRAGAAAARQHASQPVLAAADDVFEIGRRSRRAAWAARSLAPRAATIAAATPWAAATAALIIPGHELPLDGPPVAA